MNEYISREMAIKKLQMQLLDLEADQDKGEYSELCENRGAIDALDEAIYNVRTIKAADVHPIDRWISVKNRLPDKDGNYLCYLECGAVCEAAFDSTIASKGKEFPFGEWVGVYNSDTHDFTDRYWEEYDAITHWMPKPEPPKNSDTNG